MHKKYLFSILCIMRVSIVYTHYEVIHTLSVFCMHNDSERLAYGPSKPRLDRLNISALRLIGLPDKPDGLHVSGASLCANFMNIREIQSLLACPCRHKSKNNSKGYIV